jgi:Lon-like protease BrxL-like, ATPase domain
MTMASAGPERRELLAMIPLSFAIAGDAALKELMSAGTMLVIENHYLGAVLDRHQFDTFYHEHPRTYSLKSFKRIAQSLGATLSVVEFPTRYGGNIRDPGEAPRARRRRDDSRQLRYRRAAPAAGRPSVCPLPPEMRDDTAFMDRIHAYLPGCDLPKVSRDLLTNHFGLVSDFLSECWNQLRR